MEHQLSPGTFEDLCLSIGEELKAAADYRRRGTETTDTETQKVWGHIMCEELKHAAMQIALIAKDDNEFASYLWEFMNAESIIDSEAEIDYLPI